MTGKTKKSRWFACLCVKETEETTETTATEETTETTETEHKNTVLANLTRLLAMLCTIPARSGTTRLAEFDVTRTVSPRAVGGFDVVTCAMAEKMLHHIDATVKFYDLQDVLECACDLPDDHPGWPLLVLMAERSGDTVDLSMASKETKLQFGTVSDRMVVLRARIENPKFAPYSLSHALELWLTSRSKFFEPGRKTDFFSSRLKPEIKRLLDASAILRRKTDLRRYCIHDS